MSRYRNPDADRHRIAQVFDEHLLRWLPAFSGRVASRSGSPFHVALTLPTAAWCDVAASLIRPREPM